MALQNKLAIANGALIKLGEPEIASISSASALKSSRLVDERFTPCLQYVLRRHPWNFAMVRTKLLKTNLTNFSTITGITAADPAEVTVTSHPFATGDYVGIIDVDGMTEINGKVSIITDTAANTFTMDDVDSSGFTAYSANGSAYTAPPYDFVYYHDLPSDCLRLVLVEDQEIKFRVEGRRIASNEQTLEIKYVQEVDPDSQTIDPVCAEAISTYLAYDICYALTEDSSKRDLLAREYRRLIREAKHDNAIEEPTEELHADDWLDSRDSRVNRFPRDPLT